MRIGILGVGRIGAILSQRLVAAGHQVKVANSRGPETIPAEVAATGGQAVHARDVVTDVEALITSIPLSRMPNVKPLLDRLPDGAVLLDTSNYYPQRDGHIAAIDNGQVESLWVMEQLGRPLVKAWNAITSGSFNRKRTLPGGPGRLAIPLAVDAEEDRALGMSLVEQTGFDALDAGPLADSWRQQPGSPAYCTDLTREELAAAPAAAVATRSPKRRDLAMTVFAELAEDTNADRGPEYRVRVMRLIYN